MQAYKVLKDEIYNFYQKEISLQENPKYPLLTKETYELLKIIHNRNFSNTGIYASSHVFNPDYLNEFSENEVISYAFFERNKDTIQKHLKSTTKASTNIIRSLAILANRYYSQLPSDKMKSNHFSSSEVSNYGHRDDIHLSQKKEVLANSEVNYNPYIYRQALLNSFLKKQSIIIDIDLGDETSTPINPVTNRNSLSQILALPFINDEHIFIKTSSPDSVVSSILPSATKVSVKDIPEEILSLDNQIVINVDYLKQEAIREIDEQLKTNTQKRVIVNISNEIEDDDTPDEVSVQFLNDETLLSKFNSYLQSATKNIEIDNCFNEVINRCLSNPEFSNLFFKSISKKLDEILDIKHDNFKNFSNAEYANIYNLLFIKNNAALLTPKNIDVMFKELNPEQIFFLTTHSFTDKFEAITIHKSIKNRTFKNLTLFEKLQNNLKNPNIPQFILKSEEAINLYLDQIENFTEPSLDKINENNLRQSLLWASIPFLKNKTVTNKKFYDLLNLKFPLNNSYIQTFYALPPIFISNPSMREDINNYIYNSPLNSEYFNGKTSNFILTFLEVDFENSYKNWNEKLGQQDNFNFLDLPLFNNDSDTFTNDVFSIISSKPDYINFLLHSFREKYSIEESLVLNTGKASIKISTLINTFYQLNNLIYLKCANNLNSRFSHYKGIENIDNTEYFKNLDQDNLFFFLEKSKKTSETIQQNSVFHLFSISQHIFEFHKINNSTVNQRDIDFIIKLLNEDFHEFSNQSRSYNKFINEAEMDVIFPLKEKYSQNILNDLFSNSQFKNNFYNGFANNIFYLNISNKYEPIFKEHYQDKILTILPVLLTQNDIKNFSETFHSLIDCTSNDKFKIKAIQKINDILAHLTSLNSDFTYNINEFNTILNKITDSKILEFDNETQDKQFSIYFQCLELFPVDFMFTEKNSNLIIKTFEKSQENPNNYILSHDLDNLITNNHVLSIRRKIYNEKSESYEKFNLQKEQEIKKDISSTLVKSKLLKF